MNLYIKTYGNEAVKLPNDGIIYTQSDLDLIKNCTIGYPNIYCWEGWGISKIKENEDGYFDFSKNMIDVGACLGEYCWLLPFKHSYAFEPNKTTMCGMYANMLLRDRTTDIDVYNVGLSDEEGELDFDGFNFDTGDSTGVYNSNKSYKVPVKTLDSYNLTNIGLIKIDVEGFEEKVIRGGLGTIIRNNYPPILFECWPVNYYGMTQERIDSLYALLQNDLGYEIIDQYVDFETHLAIHK